LIFKKKIGRYYMKAIFNGPSSRAFSPQGEFVHQLFSRNDISDTEPETGDTFVPISINIVALQRLIMEHRLVAEELHCFSPQSKDVVRRALLDALFG
jgi:hypothetical protein